MGTTPADPGPSRRRVYDELALHHDLEHAVYYSNTGHSLKGYAFDEHGVREADVDSVWRLLSDAASWVDAHQEELDWIHPHYRGVLDLEDAPTSGASKRDLEPIAGGDSDIAR